MDEPVEPKTAEPLILPAIPERPLDSDCCGGGCVPCVMDIYQQELELWQVECDSITRGETQDTKQDIANQEEILCPKVYKKYKIIRIVNEATDIVRIRCQLPPHQSLGLFLGQHVIISIQLKKIQAFYVRKKNYEKLFFVFFTVKIYSDGRASQIVKNWKVGDSIEVRGPAGHFHYIPNKVGLLLFLNNKMIVILCQVSNQYEISIQFWLLCTCPNNYPILLPKFFLQEPESAPWRYKHGEEIQLGHLTEEIMKKELSSSQIDRVLVLVCGTRSFDKHVLTGLKEIGISEFNIHRF
ncbi:hypothetical protein EGW08_008224 [Elysia chlorotica]|uniref:FAD-binding FR-type domain-containing protein n=1 Tax=Elysia chlorotica TaxID=188477 RepID=A0A433TQV1_ELYCH|nr:hypothetical protein EGW08_008224 [Elysia chlorotica]